MLFQAISLFLAIPLAQAAAVARSSHEHHDHDHTHEVPQRLPGVWYQEPDHPVHSLFRRGPGDGYNYPVPGAQNWAAGFPPTSVPNPAMLPREWVAAYNASVASGDIPNIPRSQSLQPNTNPVYPQGVNPMSPEICSATYKCRIPGDIWDAPNGVFASSFDDGPLPLTPQLVGFLQDKGVKTTHFMIGVNIIYYPSQFLAALNAGHDIAVHTWTHPYMTTLSDLDVLGQLGWTMQLIHNATGGRVPKYWRPPYGDTDQRVNAIASAVFGLETVVWNNDTEDWGSNSTDLVQGAMAGFLSRPKTPGLIILEHETSTITVNGFINSFPLIAQNGWQFQSLADVMSGGHIYQNSDNDNAPVTAAPVYNQTMLSLATSTASSTIPASSIADLVSSSVPSPTAKPNSASSIREQRSSSLVLFLSLLAVSTVVVFS
ncbi:hypothetical protein CPB83DRAFT_781801 [Crepidotus variabilis]|uniref:chitin deacetylase n=1 Tax=Crepidotus variabilis TaxID=179855 RepID=A0A9P6EQQ2_9AGAR|nr:hypothetical protein CPB83DRAFT_781801 [Crepidotus variabilis]